MNYTGPINYTVKIRVTILPQIITSSVIRIYILPQRTAQSTAEIVYPVNVVVKPISVNISTPIINTAIEFFNISVNSYIDEDRELKTLLNYGEDRQSVVLAYRSSSVDVSGVSKIQLKLLQPVPNDIGEDSPVFLSREVAKTLIDKVRIRLAPPVDNTPYLRPKNLRAPTNISVGNNLRNVTLNTLSLISGSIGAMDSFANKTFEDEIFRKWYSYDFNSSELNMDFSDYNNFVFYGSAGMRLTAFREKLRLLESLDNKRLQFNGNYIGNSALAGRGYVQQQSAEFAKQQEDIIRGFDRYEQFLYFTTGSANIPYTASAFYANDGYEYNSIAYWPKSGSTVWPVTSYSASAWYDAQLDIARRFDDFNENNLINTIPTHIREDDDNGSYLTFITMIGHFFDIIKPYVDQFPNIYSRNLDPNTELSKDLINEVAESIGFTLPTLNAVYNLSDNILGTETKAPRRDYTSETYKRLLHNLPFFAKAKGSKTALDSLLRTFGITQQVISIKESGTPTSSMYNVFDEFSSGIDFDAISTSNIRLPLSASQRNPRTLQFNCTVAQNNDMTILTGDDDGKWGLHAIVHPTIPTLGKIQLTSGSSNNIILSSSYYPIFGDELLNITIQNFENAVSLRVIQVDGEDILFNSTATSVASSFVPLWESTQFIYMGGAGAGVISRFDGTIDEVRLWGTTLTDDVVLNTAFDPGSNAGNSYSDSADSLYVQLSFNVVDTGSLPILLVNESPYKNILNTPSLQYIDAANINTSDFSRYNRTVRQATMEVGSSAYQTNKIKVVADPVFENQNDKRLYRDKSIVFTEAKQLQRGRNKVIISTSPTDIVNQNIIRNFGYSNINNIIGLPEGLEFSSLQSLRELKKYYEQYYYVDVNINSYIRILSSVNSVLNEVIPYFIPSKATLLSGIVIEQNILEQVKIPRVRSIKVYGANTRITRDLEGLETYSGSKKETEGTFNLSDTIVTSENIGFNSINPSYKTSINIDELSDVSAGYTKLAATIADAAKESSGSNNTFKSIIESSEAIPSGDNNLYHSGKIINSPAAIVAGTSLYAGDSGSGIIRFDVLNLNKLKFNNLYQGTEGAEPFGRVYSRKLFDYEVTNINTRNEALYSNAIYEIPPVADFKDTGVTTYFNSLNGIYYFPINKKTPIYRNPLNSTWNESTQNFDTATTWSYGASYKPNDVVYQYVTSGDPNTDRYVNPFIPGNNVYYVFTTAPSYVPTTDNTSYYLNEVPSYIPPALDQVNWKRLRFIPYQVLEPKRIVFDVFTVSDPVLNNFQVTTIDPEQEINIPNRFIKKFMIGTLRKNAIKQGELSVDNIAILFALQSNASDLRIRLYRTSAARNDDLSREIGATPSGSHGILLDAIVDSVGTRMLTNPIPTLVAGAFPPTGKIYYSITNLSSVDVASASLTLFYFALELVQQIPIGHLRKHYRYFKDTSTSTRRRNYYGCKNTKNSTIDGKDSIVITSVTNAAIVTNAGIQNTEIQIGGGGTLNAI